MKNVSSILIKLKFEQAVLQVSGLSYVLVTLRAGRMAGLTTPPTPGRPGSALGCPWALPIRFGVCRPYAPALRASYS